MADNESFFRKVVRFVANPATDWTELNSRQEDSKELELEKSELKAMIERKRRNDFVRKREFDMLRRVRREGLSPEQLAALGTSSRLDDSEARLPDVPGVRPDGGVKAKIDEIEQQMVGDAGFTNTRGARSSRSGLALTEPAPFDSAHGRAQDRPPAQGGRPSRSGSLGFAADDDERLPALPPLPVMNLPPAAAPSPVQMSGGLPPLAPLSAVSFDTPGQDAGQAGRLRDAVPVHNSNSSGNSSGNVGINAHPADGGGMAVKTNGGSSAVGGGTGGTAINHDSDFGNSPFAVEVSEVVHDPELDEAVIAFANADFAHCEDALQRITAPHGARAQHAETWLVLFDLYRATGQQQRFESLALDYAQQFGWSAPQWYSLPKLVAEAQADDPVRTSAHHRAQRANRQGDAHGGANSNAHGNAGGSAGGHAGSNAGSEPGSAVGWVSPAHLDIEAVARLRSQTLQMPLPWVFDWHQLQRIDAEAAMQLSMLMRLWSGQTLELRWLGGERLFSVLQEAAPTGVRDADPAFWLTRLDALRLANRADQFDEAAIDYCVTYEVSPPSWEPTRCKVHISGSSVSTRTPDLSMVSEVSTSFLESDLGADSQASTEMAHVELSGQLIGDISATVAKLQGELGSAPVISVSCERLIRVDFIAAGDLLNWVLAKRSDNRAVQFVDTHRLIALFFGAMGINEHARVQVRKV